MTTIDINKYWTYESDEFSDRGPPENIFLLPEHLGWLNDCHDLVDLGCGVGNLVKYWRDQGKNATGVTYNPHEVSRAKEKHDIIIQLGDLHDLPYNDHSFDGMICWDALEHTVSPYIALCEARRVVRPGGKGLIFIPGHLWWHTSYHIICPTQEQMKHLFNISGWTLQQLYDKSNVPGHAEQKEMAVYEITT